MPDVLHQDRLVGKTASLNRKIAKQFSRSAILRDSELKRAQNHRF